MFDANSRYVNLQTRELVTVDGRHIVYVRRRIVPPANTYTPVGRVAVTDSDRIDLLTYQNMGTPAAFWQIADANEAMHPEDLTAEVSRDLLIPLPRFPEANK